MSVAAIKNTSMLATTSGTAFDADFDGRTACPSGSASAWHGALMRCVTQGIVGRLDHFWARLAACRLLQGVVAACDGDACGRRRVPDLKSARSGVEAASAEAGRQRTDHLAEHGGRGGEPCRYFSNAAACHGMVGRRTADPSQACQKLITLGPRAHDSDAPPGKSSCRACAIGDSFFSRSRDALACMCATSLASWGFTR